MTTSHATQGSRTYDGGTSFRGKAKGGAAVVRYLFGGFSFSGSAAGEDFLGSVLGFLSRNAALPGLHDGGVRGPGEQ